MTKPKGKVPSLLSMATGTPLPYLCKKKCSCSRCKGVLEKDQDCFQIPKTSSGFTNKHIFCVDCTIEIVAQTKKEIANIETNFKAD